MTVEHTLTGWLVVSATVTDGVDTWLKSETFQGYSEDEANALFAESLEQEGLKFVYEEA